MKSKTLLTVRSAIGAGLVCGLLLSAAAAAQNTASGNYRIDAVTATGEPLIEDGADVFVLDAQGDVVVRRHAVPAIVDLEPGDYTAVVVYKHAQARGTLQPGTAPGTNALNLNAGEVVLTLVRKDGTRKQARDLAWTVYRYRPGADHGRKVAASASQRPELLLDAGWYEVHARFAGADGRSRVVHVIQVRPGRQQTYSIAPER